MAEDDNKPIDRALVQNKEEEEARNVMERVIPIEAVREQMQIKEAELRELLEAREEMLRRQKEIILDAREKMMIIRHEEIFEAREAMLRKQEEIFEASKARLRRDEEMIRKARKKMMMKWHEEMMDRARRLLDEKAREHRERRELRVLLAENDLQNDQWREPIRERIVTDEMIAAAVVMREEDEKSDPSPLRFSHRCHVCLIVNPRQRAVYSQCGHVICYPCAVEIAKTPESNEACPSCNLPSAFVKLFEDEEKIDPSPLRFSNRCCPVCLITNPHQRAVYSQCGHIFCYPCAVEIAKIEVAAREQDGRQEEARADEPVPEIDDREIRAELAQIDAQRRRRAAIDIVQQQAIAAKRRRVSSVTDEMAAEAAKIREKDEQSNPSPIRYSRLCLICYIVNPSQRAVYSKCGHTICYPCAVEIAKQEEYGGKCPMCQSPTDFVKLFEDEQKDVNDEKK